MASIQTQYLGLKLNSPIIVSAGPLTEKIDSLKKLENAGAGAVVLKSIFEEQINLDSTEASKANEEFLNFSGAESAFVEHNKNYLIDKYMRLLMDAKKELSIPVIASVCCKTKEGWSEFVERFVSCGADAIELNYYPIASDAKIDGKDVDKALFDFVKTARKSTNKPISIKLGSRYSSLANVISTLDKLKIDGAVLFNRFYMPDINIDKMEFVAGSPLSQSDDYLEALRWIGLMSGETTLDLCANTGIHDYQTVIKMLLAGAKAVEILTPVIKKGPEAITDMNKSLSSWMDSKGIPDISTLMGQFAQERIKDGYNWERTQFMKMI